MRTLAALLLWFPAIASAQTSYEILVNGRHAGEATMSQRLLASGGKYVEFILTLRKGSDRVVVKSQITLTATGAPEREIQQVGPFGRPPERQVITTFDSKGAEVVEKVRSVPKSYKIVIDPGLSRADASQFWFLRDQPKSGAVCRAYRFNLDTKRWYLAETTYVGQEAGGFHVKQESEGRTTDTIFDAQGVPKKIDDSSGMQMVRD